MSRSACRYSPSSRQVVLFLCLNLCLVYFVFFQSEATDPRHPPWRDDLVAGLAERQGPPGQPPPPSAGPDHPLRFPAVLEHGEPGVGDSKTANREHVGGGAAAAAGSDTNAVVVVQPGGASGDVDDGPKTKDKQAAASSDTERQEAIGKGTAAGPIVSISNMTEENGDRTVPTMDPDLEAALLDSSEIELGERVVPSLYSPGRRLQSVEEFEQLMSFRSRKIRRACRLKGTSTPIIYTGVFYVLQRVELVWCPVYKAASTNWMHNLLYLAGLTDQQVEDIKAKFPQQPNDQARAVAPILPRSQLSAMIRKPSSRKLIIVRHPFDRLVSAFRDKLERCHGPANCTLENDWYYKQYGRKIVSTYRQPAQARFSRDYFSEKNNFGAPLKPQQTWRNADLPTWWEFVQYIKATPPRHHDEHWRPASLYCSLCSLSYNYILHFENIQQEEQLFAQQLGAEGTIRKRWENRNDEGLRKEEVVAKYFDLLDDDDIMALYNIYEDDFKMFGYQFEFRGLRLNTL